MTERVPPKWQSLDEALVMALAQIVPIDECESVALQAANGRILAKGLTAQLNVPPWDNSAMDGYAVVAAEAHADAQLTVTDTLLAGMDPTSIRVSTGTAVRIMTGAPLPPGADAVVMQENTRAEDRRVTILKAPEPGENVRNKGCDIAMGEEVIAPGTRLTPAHLMLLASLGLETVEVCRRARVAIVATGDELVAAGQPCQAGQIYESNRLGIRSLLEPYNAELIDLGILPDDPGQIKKVFAQAADNVDLLISSGGVSVGEADFVKDIISQLGHIEFWKVAIKPGKPFAFGRLGSAVFCGVPGNPVSAYVTTQQLVLPVLAQLQGEANVKQHGALQIRARTRCALKRKAGRLDFQRARLEFDDQQQAWVTPLDQQSSAVMTTVTAANCYMRVEAHVSELEQGDWVSVQPFNLSGLWK